MDGPKRPNFGNVKILDAPRWYISWACCSPHCYTLKHCRLGGHSIHQYASRLAAIGIQKFPELSSYGTQIFHLEKSYFILTKNEKLFLKRLKYFLVQESSPSLYRSTQPSTHCEYESLTKEAKSVSESFAKGWNN